MSAGRDTRKEYFRTDPTNWVIGPYHGALPGPLKLTLKLDGEVMVTGEVERGYLHRGLEKAMELHSWRGCLPYSDHLDPEAAIFGELAFCLAVEQIAGAEVPARAQAIRIALSELTRISSHLGFMSRCAQAAGSETMVHYLLRDREKILDLFELLTGSRFSLNFLRFGGVMADVTEGFIERVLDLCELLRIRMKEYNDLFSFNQAFLKRTCFLGVLDRATAISLGITGPNARASGIGYDARKDDPYSGYAAIDLEVPLGKGEGGELGDAHDRYLVRLREISQSVEILKQVVESMPAGPHGPERPLAEANLAAGEAYARVESPRGLLGCHVVSDGGPRPSRVQFRAPSVAHLAAVPELLSGARIDDLPVLLASLDIGVAEADR